MSDTREETKRGTLLLVHAHPDDEAIATGGVMLRAHDEGRRVVLVTATRGERGEIHNMDEASTRPRLGEVRTEELRRAGQILGVDRQVFLGYVDSGMAGTDGNDDPASFHRATLLEAAGMLAGVLREERPDVVVTYGADGIYGHPDHVKAHEVTVAALDLMQDLEGWAPAKAYFAAVPASGIEAMRKMAQEQGVEAFADDAGSIRVIGVPDEVITTRVDVSDVVDRKRAAFAAHVSQNDPNSPFATMADSIYRLVFGTEHYVLARGALGADQEADLFEGLD
jgi:N-acetyl-1-D-myo-inositol-2-amino-2-deoxy-alpha-D-glucopyranoside deacetylase